MEKKLSILTYTNQKTADIWKIFFEQLNYNFDSKYYKNHFILTDKSNEYLTSVADNNNKIKLLYYNDTTDLYYDQLLYVLDKINTEYILYLQEDYILFDTVDIFQLDECINLLESERIDFIRLIRSGVSNDLKPVNFHNHQNNIYLIDCDSSYLFSLQATIWKKSSLIKLLMFLQKNHTNHNIFNTIKGIQCEGFINSICKQNNLVKGLLVYNNEQPVPNSGHYYSNIFPYIATAIVRGKWNLRNYHKILDSLLNKYKIDATIRGIFK